MTAPPAQHNARTKLVRFVVVFATCCLNAIPTWAAPPSGTLITNQAQSTYTRALGPGATPSNLVQLAVGVNIPAVLTITDQVSAASIQPGEALTYRLTGNNSGAIHASGVPVTIDGNASSRVIVRAPIPPNTSFTSFAPSPGTGMTPLYHIVGTPLHTYATSAPSDLNSVDAVAVAMLTAPSGNIGQYGFNVRVHDNAAINSSGRILNMGTASYVDTVNPPLRTGDSNVVQTNIAAVSAAIRNYSGPDYGVASPYVSAGHSLYLRTDAAACNADASVVETRVALITGPNGESEQYTATETAPNSGVFVLAPVPTKDATVVPNDGVVEIRNGETISVSLQGCGTSIVTTIALVDPGGVVYDSRTNQPIANATVTLVRASGSACTSTPADVSQLVGGVLQPAASTVVTGSEGSFAFPLVSGGAYCLRVTPPSNYVFPSKLSAGEQPSGRRLLVTGQASGGSYGGVFLSTVATGPVTVDVPLDSFAPGSLFVQKLASRTTAEIADFVDYTVRVKNNVSTTQDVIVTDNLPAGFAYEPGTARLAGAGNVEPEGGRGARLTFTVPALAGNAEATITYRVRIGPGALQGDGVNRASASALSGTSNVASATVKVQGGVFSDRGFILGKTYVDCNQNGIQDSSELGIPNVRLYLEDGTNVVTDTEGKFSFYGISPRTHVLKVDRSSLPPGAQLAAIANRNAGDGGSRFIDLKAGELHRADFAEGTCSASVLDDVKVRQARAAALANEAQRVAGGTLKADAATQAPTDVKALPASGVVSTAQGTTFTPVVPRQEVEGQPMSVLPAPPVPIAPTAEMETQLEGVTADFGFMDLKDGDTLATAQTNVRLKGPLGGTYLLSVNGKSVPVSRVGKKSVLTERQVEAWEYIGVDLKAGRNLIEAKLIDAFGIERETLTVHVIAPDRLGKLAITPQSNVSADGRSVAHVEVKLTDANGVPVTSRTPLTLEASRGRWQVADTDPKEPGVQVFIEGGSAKFPLLAPIEPGESAIRVSSGAIKAEARQDFLPDLRDLIAAGVIEGVLDLRNLNAGALQPARASDGFEQELKRWSHTSANGNERGSARAAMFLKGKIKGSYLLTLGYDSEKQTRERLFRDIQPDEFYPIYGDASVRGFDAQSTGRLYVRVDKEKSYLLYGDFNTQSPTDARKLSNYSRSLTGMREHYENDRVSINAFASRDSTRQVVDELRAIGTSGPFQLSAPGFIENSEKIEILIRDRNQPAIILKSTPQARFVDYEIEPLTERLLFRAPIASLDPNLNPISIRVTYEVEQGGEAFWTAGVDGRVKLNDRIEVGGVYVDDRNPQNPSTLTGANATVKLAEQTVVTAEIAESNKLTTGRGQGSRVELRHEHNGLKAHVFTARTDVEFDNPSASLNRGRGESGARLAYQVDEKTSVRGEAIRTEDISTGGHREGALAAIERKFDNGVRVELGVRNVTESATAAQPTSVGTTPNNITSIRGRVTTPVPALPQAKAYGEYEQDVHENDKRMAAVGADYQIANRGRLYARHELLSSLGGPYGLTTSQRQNATVVGLDTDYMKDGRLFSEYRTLTDFSGGDTEAAIGLRNQWNLQRGLKLNTSFEQIHTLAGSGRDESIAGTVGVDYSANPRWRGTARLELRDATTSQTVLTTQGLAAKLDDDWTFLARHALAITRNKGNTSGERLQDRIQVGLAYRDTDTNVWSALGRVEHRFERDDTSGTANLRRDVDILSMHGNYQISRPLILNGRIAAKWAEDQSNGLSTRYNAQLIGARATYDLSEKWDVGLLASALVAEKFRSRHYGLGLEVGRVLTKNLWLSVGYNVFGFHDDALSGTDYTRQGAFLRLRFKFDEDLFRSRTELN